MSEQRAISLSQEKLNEIWNGAVLLSTLRVSLKHYALWVGAAGNLQSAQKDVLTPFLRTSNVATGCSRARSTKPHYFTVVGHIPLPTL